MKDKEYLGCMVDLMKFFINDQVECSDYLIEEFCNKNIIIEYLMNCPSYEIKKFKLYTVDIRCFSLLSIFSLVTKAIFIVLTPPK